MAECLHFPMLSALSSIDRWILFLPSQIGISYIIRQSVRNFTGHGAYLTTQRRATNDKVYVICTANWTNRIGFPARNDISGVCLSAYVGLCISCTHDCKKIVARIVVAAIGPIQYPNSVAGVDDPSACGVAYLCVCSHSHVQMQRQSRRQNRSG